jgi:hypothetical protein
VKGEVAQTMYIHVSKCKNNKIKYICEKTPKKMKNRFFLETLFFFINESALSKEGKTNYRRKKAAV